MSGELPKNFSDYDVSQAKNRLSAELAATGSAENYLAQLEHRYATDSGGRVELHRMFRVATFIMAPKQLDTEGAAEATRAFYTGQLLAYGFLDHFKAGEGLTAGLSHNYLQSRLKASQPKGPFSYPDADQPSGVRKSWIEPAHETGQRHLILARTIQLDLMADFKMENDEPFYIDVAEDLAYDLFKTPEAPLYAIMGFHMIMKEWGRPQALQDTEKVMASVENVPQLATAYTLGSTAMNASTRMGASPEADPNAPSLEELHKLVDYVEGPQSVELPSSARRTIIHRFNQLHASSTRNFSTDPANQEGYIALQRVELELALLIAKKGYFQPEDVITANGFFFGTHPRVPGSLTFIEDDTDVYGVFAGIHVTKVPTVDDLKNIITKGGDPDTVRVSQWAPVLRLKDPTFVTYFSDDKQHSTHVEGEFFDIPLIYRGITIDRLTNASDAFIEEEEGKEES